MTLKRAKRPTQSPTSLPGRWREWRRYLPWLRRALPWLAGIPLLGGIGATLGLPGATSLWSVWQALWGALAWPLAFVLALVPALSRARFPAPTWDPRTVLGVEIFVLSLLALFSLLWPPAASRPGAGGWIGDLLAREGVALLGRWPTFGVTLVGLALGTFLCLRYRPWDPDEEVIWRWWLWARAQVGPWLGWHLPASPRPRLPQRWAERWERLRRRLGLAPAPEDLPAATAVPPVESDYALPPSSLLAREDVDAVDTEDVQRRARLIREALAGFGIPVRVVEIHQGPAVTQYCVQPLTVKQKGKKRRVSVRRILSVQNDLALVLAAAPIRIEAPVPGKPYVGIEVPNATIHIVRLGGVMASDAFQRLRSPLALALGRDVTGNPVVADLTKLPHLLIAGATGAGKSVAINSMIITWLMRNTPHDLRLLLVDPKRVELTGYAGIPHLVGPVVTEVDEVPRALTWVLLEMDERYRRFAQARVRHLSGYNAWARRHQQPPLPYLVVIIDELADIMLAGKGEVEYMLARLAQMARATGIHLVVATQRPSVDVITGLIKANFPARLAFAVASQVDSRVILDMPGAENLLGRGDALFLPPDRPSPIRLQGSYVSDEEIARVVGWWREHAEDTPPATPPWAHLPQGEAETLLRRALALIREEERVSASFLQRKLHIGFKRAQSLIEELEAMGAVGPDEGGGRGRRVLLHEEPPAPPED